MTEPTESERAELNVRLARAMGIPDDRWTFQCLKEDHLLDGHGPHAFCLTCVAPVNKSALVPPDFTRDLAASRELVAWVAGQPPATQSLFLAELQAALPFSEGVRRELQLMAASSLVTAYAADAATGGSNA